MDQVVETSVEDGLGVALLDAGAVVLDHLVGMEDVAPDLAAEADVLGLAPLRAELRLPLLLLELDDPALQDPQRGLSCSTAASARSGTGRRSRWARG